MTANVNVTKLLFKRGNTVQNANYTGINGEITVDTQAKTLRIHDGVTAGGNVITAGGVVGAYSNTNAAAYIPVDPTITSIQANVAAANAAISAITGIDTSLIANAATQQTQINLVNANVTAANAAITSLQSNAGVQATSIDTIYANVGSFQTYANLHFGDSNYGNTNVAAYLGAFDGNILPSANVTYSLGDSTHQWKDLWVSNNTIYIGNTPIRVDGGTLLVNGAPVATTVANLVNGASTFQLFANGESRSPDTIFASNGVSIINANGAIQGGIYNSGDADWFNIGATTGRGIKFYVNEETQGPLFFANGSANVPNNLYSSAGIIGDVSMYGGTISGTNPAWNNLTLINQVEGSVFVQLPSEATANVANLRIHNDIGNVELATGDGFINNYWYFRSDGNLIIPGNINYANGTSILSGLGAITGNISVDDSAIQFVANSSGDGYGLSTIRLVPYTQGYESAIIIIDPTYPNHIHIRAGFEQDNAEANLFLGGEASHFNVEEGANPNVSIRSNYYTWTFNNTGTMIVPDGSAIRPLDSNAAVGGSLTIRAGDSVYEDSGSMTIRAGDTIGAGGAVDAGSMVIRAGTNVTGTGGQAQLEAGSTINGNAGDLLLYSGQTVTGAGGNVAILAGTTVTGDAGSVNIESGEAVSGDSGNITITARGTTTGNAGGISLTAGSATTGPGGSLLFTAGSTVGGDGGNIILISGDNNNSGSPGVIRLRTVNAAVNQDWIFDNGNLTFPSGGNVTFDASAVSTIDGITNISATGTIGANVVQVLSDLTSFGASPAPVIYGFRSIATTGSAVNEGNISASGNLVASQNAYVTGNVFAARYNFANGVNILSTVGAGSYGNTEVAAYLPTYTGNIGAGNVNVTSTVYATNIVTSGTSGNISGVNVISANTFVFAANGVNILSAAGGSYGNTEVAAYLLTWPNIDANILDVTSGNITTLRAPNFNSANAVISGGYISALTNASIISATITTLNSTGGNITTLRATNFGTANAVITGGYINSLANLTATTAVFTNFSTGNAVISGGYISALTNAYITTSAITNFSTANAVITGGYASGLANVTATGNVTAGNLIGYGSNTSIIAGAYTSTFDNVGNVILPNAYVSGNTTVMGIAPGYAPNRPAFRVYGNGAVPIWHNTANVNLKGSAITVDHNQGNYFDSTTGKFTVPVAGLYITTLQARVGDNNGLNQIAVLKNGNNSGANVVCFWETDTNTGTATHFGTSGVVVLAPGDFLSANILAGNINFDGNDSWTVTYLG